MRPDGPALGVCVKLRVAPDKGCARGAKVPSSGVREHQPNRQPEISLPPFRVMRYIPQTHTHSLIHPLVGWLYIVFVGWWQPPLARSLLVPSTMIHAGVHCLKWMVGAGGPKHASLHTSDMLIFIAFPAGAPVDRSLSDWYRASP